MVVLGLPAVCRTPATWAEAVVVLLDLGHWTPLMALEQQQPVMPVVATVHASMLEIA